MAPGILWVPISCFTMEAVPRTSVPTLSSKASSDFGDCLVDKLRGIFAFLLPLSLHFLCLAYVDSKKNFLSRGHKLQCPFSMTTATDREDSRNWRRVWWPGSAVVRRKCKPTFFPRDFQEKP